MHVELSPSEGWEPQQNAVVNGHLESAQAVGVSVAERARVRGVADVVSGTDAEDGGSDRSGGLGLVTQAGFRRGNREGGASAGLM